MSDSSIEPGPDRDRATEVTQAYPQRLLLHGSICCRISFLHHRVFGSEQGGGMGDRGSIGSFATRPTFRYFA